MHVCKICYCSIAGGGSEPYPFRNEFKNILQHLNLRLETAQYLTHRDLICKDCHCSFEELRRHYIALQGIKATINKVFNKLQNRVASSLQTESDYGGPPTTEQSVEFKEVKEEPEEINEEEDSTEFIISGYSDTDQVNQSGEGEDDDGEIKVEYSDNESMDESNDDDTEEFIISQLLAPDSSDSEVETRKSRKSQTRRISSSDSEESETKPRRKSKRIKSTKLKADQTKSKPSTKPTTTTTVSQRFRKASAPFECTCDLCVPLSIFPSLLELSKHYEMDHKDTPKEFYCYHPTCEEKILTYDFLEIHKKVHVSMDWRSLTGAPMLHKAFCHSCRLSSFFPDELRNHELKEHPQKLKHKCQICDSRYFSKEILEAHKLSHTASNSLEVECPLECPLCPEKWRKIIYANAPAFESHLIRMHAFPFEGVPKGCWTPAHSIGRPSKKGLPRICPKCGKQYVRKVAPHICSGGNCLKCEICGKSIVTKRGLVSHCAVKHEGEANSAQWKSHLSCPKCPANFTTTFMFKRHVNCHNMETKLPFYCGACEERFKEESQLTRHKKAFHHPESQAPIMFNLNMITCETCGRLFSSIYYFRKHERKNHPEIFTFLCNQCECSFSQKEFLETHLKTHDPTGPFTCTACTKKPSSSSSFETGKDLDDHLKSHHTVGSGKSCPTCGDIFKCNVQLARHQNAAHGVPKPLECPHAQISGCPRRFTDLRFLREHVERAHSGEEVLRRKQEENRRQCTICEGWFSSKKSLYNHVKKIHEKRQPIDVCEICGKAMKSGKSWLRQHMKIHMEEKNFACDFCDKRFVTNGALRVHRYVHTGEKPLACYICDKRFNQHSPLNKHVETHKKDGSWFPKPPKKIVVVQEETAAKDKST